MFETSDEWIVQRTGIKERHIAADGETTSMLAIKACQAALADAGMQASEIDLIVCGTSTPDYTFPSTASLVQHGLGQDARLVMTVHPILESRLYAALRLIGQLDFVRGEPRAIRVIEEEFV